MRVLFAYVSVRPKIKTHWKYTGIKKVSVNEDVIKLGSVMAWLGVNETFNSNQKNMS